MSTSIRQSLTHQDVGNSAKEPVKPVEDWTIFAVWLATAQRDDGL